MPKSKLFYTFREARRIARGHGFESKEEFLEYNCPGAYQLPKNPDEIWSAGWAGWVDFLGICHKNFEEARDIARNLGLSAEDEYLALFEQKKIVEDSPAYRLPFRPDKHYKTEWKGWEDWLVGSSK